MQDPTALYKLIEYITADVQRALGWSVEDVQPEVPGSGWFHPTPQEPIPSLVRSALG